MAGMTNLSAWIPIVHVSGYNFSRVYSVETVTSVGVPLQCVVGTNRPRCYSDTVCVDPIPALAAKGCMPYMEVKEKLTIFFSLGVYFLNFGFRFAILYTNDIRVHTSHQKQKGAYPIVIEECIPYTNRKRVHTPYQYRKGAPNVGPHYFLLSAICICILIHNFGSIIFFLECEG